MTRNGLDIDDADSTLSDIQGPGHRSARAAWVRGTVTLLMVAVLVGAGSGLLGVHSQYVSATGGGFTLSVTYAGVARPGLDVPLRIDVHPDQPFGDEIVIAINRDYLNLFETQGFHPDPSASTSLGDDVLLTFDTPPGGGDLVIDYDAYIQPASQAGASGRVSVMRGERRLVTTEFDTFLFP